MFDYKGRVVVVSGASSGLGRQLAKAFAKQGADLVITARRLEKLKELEAECKALGAKCISVRCDVTQDADIDAAVKATIDAYGKVDVLLNVAGSAKGGSVLEMTNEAWDFTIETDLTSVFKVSRAFGKYMVEKGYGRIINIASMYGLIGTNQQQCAYHASKAGVVNYTRAAAAELAPSGVTVNAICPGFFPTELTDAVIRSEPFVQYMNLTVPAKRAGRDGELDAAAIFLGSEEASYVTGVALPVDGGWSSAK